MNVSTKKAVRADYRADRRFLRKSAACMRAHPLPDYQSRSDSLRRSFTKAGYAFRRPGPIRRQKDASCLVSLVMLVAGVSLLIWMYASPTGRAFALFIGTIIMEAK